jgi:glycyl-tRNA synthetase beta chain
MRWNSDFSFARPIRWIVALLDDKVIELEVAGVKTGRKSFGLRGEGSIHIESADSYLSSLRKSCITVNQSERREYILSCIKREAEKVGCDPFLDEELVDEITYMTEDPVILRGRFSRRFLKIPKDVLIASMVYHQRYLPLLRDSEITEWFLVVSNGRRSSVPLVRKGHQRVLAARLSDATFFWKEDMKHPIERLVEKEKGVVWQNGLGTLYEKTMRIVRLATSLAIRLLPESDIPYVSKAAYLCKADLMTQTVSEFPSLQGIMGYHIALAQGIERRIAEALKEHYFSLPKSPIASVVNLADRIDTLVGFFSLGLIPKGSEDPYALRRSALSIIKIALCSPFKTHILLDSLIREACAGYSITDDKVVENLFQFLKARLIQALSSDFPKEVVDAVIKRGFYNLKDVKERASALAEFLKDPQSPSLVISTKRVVNILGDRKEYMLDKELFSEDAEKELCSLFFKTKEEVERVLSKRDYKRALKMLSELRPAIDRFFDEVMVCVDDQAIMKNRLALLSLISDLLTRIADTSSLTDFEYNKEHFEEAGCDTEKRD